MFEPCQETVGTRLRAERERLRFSQKHCAISADVGLSTWKRWEQDNPIPSDKLAVLPVLGFDINYVLTGKRLSADGPRWPTGPTLDEYPIYGEVVQTLAHATGMPQSIEGLDRFSRQALGIFLRAVRISEPAARQAEIRELVLLVAQSGEEIGN